MFQFRFPVPVWVNEANYYTKNDAGKNCPCYKRKLKAARKGRK